MPPTPRTLLAQTLQERHWTVDEFVRQFNRAGRRSGPDNRDHAISRRQATRWVSGRLPSLPHPASQRVLETMFGTDAAALLASPDAPLPITTPDDDGQAPLATPEEMSPSRRRDLLSLGVAVPASLLIAGDPVDRAARISRAIAASTPDPLTLAQLQQGIQQLTTLFSVTPHADLVLPIERAWDDAETLLDSRVAGPTRLDLELVAGQFAFYRGMLAFDMDDKQTALIFLVLAGQHAEAAGDSC